jgi:hypothetical protein
VKAVEFLIDIDDALVADIDAIVGPGRRGELIRDAVRTAVELHHRRGRLDLAAGTIGDAGHEWDADAAAWVRRQRTGDSQRIG